MSPARATQNETLGDYVQRQGYGTDFYDLEQKAFQQFELFQRFQVAADIRDRISSGNARRLLKLT